MTVATTTPHDPGRTLRATPAIAARRIAERCVADPVQEVDDLPERMGKTRHVVVCACEQSILRPLDLDKLASRHRSARPFVNGPSVVSVSRSNRLSNPRPQTRERCSQNATNARTSSAAPITKRMSDAWSQACLHHATLPMACSCWASWWRSSAGVMLSSSLAMSPGVRPRRCLSRTGCDGVGDCCFRSIY